MIKNKKAKITFPLPFYLPIVEETTFVSHYADYAVFKFQFKKYKNEYYITETKLEEYRTSVILEFMYDKDITHLSEEDFIGNSVKNSIIYLNDFLDAFRLVNNWEFVKNFSITDLSPIIEIELSDKLISYVTTPTALNVDKITFDIKQTEITMERLSTWASNRYFQVIDKFLSKAIHHLHTEEFIFAVIELQTSFESYIRLCQNIIHIQIGTEENQIEIAKGHPFRNTIEQFLSKFLKEELSFTNNKVINEWYINLYMLRNSIVHSGLSYISGDEAYLAYDSLKNVIKYMSELMILNGFMKSDGTIEIAKLNKNTKQDVDFGKVMKSLKDRGFLNK